MYDYRPRANRIDTPFTGVAVDAVDILRTLLGLTVPPLPLVVLACAEGINRFYWGSWMPTKAEVAQAMRGLIIAVVVVVVIAVVAYFLLSRRRRP